MYILLLQQKMWKSFKLKKKTLTNICTSSLCTNKITINFFLLDKLIYSFQNLLPNIKFCNPSPIMPLLKGLLRSFQTERGAVVPASLLHSCALFVTFPFQVVKCRFDA